MSDTTRLVVGIETDDVETAVWRLLELVGRPEVLDWSITPTETDHDDHRLDGALPDEQPAPPPWADDDGGDAEG